MSTHLYTPEYYAEESALQRRRVSFWEFYGCPFGKGFDDASFYSQAGSVRSAIVLVKDTGLFAPWTILNDTPLDFALLI
jgi:hypothetical protein